MGFQLPTSTGDFRISELNQPLVGGLQLLKGRLSSDASYTLPETGSSPQKDIHLPGPSILRGELVVSGRVDRFKKKHS